MNKVGVIMATSPLGIGYDTTFELSEFNEPRLKSEIEVIKDALLFVLFAKPGNYPSLPLIGLDIPNMLYSFYDEINCDELKNRIIEQCAMLGEFIADGTIVIRKTIYKSQPSLLININGQEQYPDGYLSDDIGTVSRYLIGITYDEFQNLIYNINTQGGA